MSAAVPGSSPAWLWSAQGRQDAGVIILISIDDGCPPYTSRAREQEETGLNPEQPVPKVSPRKPPASTQPDAPSKHKQAGQSPATQAHRLRTTPQSTATSCPGNVPWKCGMSPMHLECLKADVQADVQARLLGAARPGLSVWPILLLHRVMGSLQTAPRIRHRIPPILLQDYRIPTVGEWLSPSGASLQAEIPRL